MLRRSMSSLVLLILVGSAVGTAQMPIATLGTKELYVAQRVSYSPDGKLLLVCSGGKATMYDTGKKKPTFTIMLLTGGSNVNAISGNNKQMVIAGGNTAQVYDLGKPKLPLFTLNTEKGVHAVAYSPDDKHILTGCLGGVIQVWDAATGKLANTLKGHTTTITGIAFSPDGKTMATGELNKTVLLWDAAKGEQIGKLVDKVDDLKGPTTVLKILTFGKEGKTLVSVGSDGKSLLVWDVVEKKKTGEVADPMGRGISAAKFTPDGKKLAVAINGSLQFWDLSVAKPTDSIETKFSLLPSLSISPDGKTIAVGTNEGVTLLFAVPGDD